MSVRHKLLGGYLVIAALVAAVAGVALRLDVLAAHRAAVTEARNAATSIAKDVGYGLAADSPGEQTVPLYQNPAALVTYLSRLHDLQNRDAVVVDAHKRILADVVPQNIGTTYDSDTGNEIGRTIADGRPRTFVEVSPDYPAGIREVVVPFTDSGDKRAGAVLLEYTPLYDEMMAADRDAETAIVAAGAVGILLVLGLGWLLSGSIARRLGWLTAAVHEIREGDLTHRVAMPGRDEISRLGGAFDDLADRLEQSAREILAKEYTDSILANAGDGICGVDAAGRITFANEAAGRLTGRGVEGLLGLDWAELLPETGPAEGDGVEREIGLDRPDDASVRVAWTRNTITKNGRPLGAVIVLRDVTRQRALEHDLRHQALHDGLTDLPNRKLFLDRLEHAMARARGTDEAIGVLYLDLDGFKKVNDSLGHNAGDQLLRTAAERLRAVLRPHDTVARLGGDEFAVLLEGTESMDTQVAALLRTLSEPFLLHGREATVSASIGVVPDAARYADGDEVVRNADVAMYAAKAGGKDRYQVFESRMHEQLLDRLEKENRLREAVHRGELRVHLQPVVEVPTRRLAGVEALVRWQDPEHGLQQPGAFVPLAEETGLITEIDRWVLLEACRAVNDWQQTWPDTAPAWVSVNLSAANLEVPDLTDRVAYALATSGLSPRCLVLELTETVLMRDVAVTAQRLEELRELGVQIAIDDFGTGYSSLGYLRDIPVDVLKVDRSFIIGLVTLPRQQELVSAVVQLGHTLGLKVVAEGIEDEDQLRALEAMGCRYAQGYHLGRPQPPETLIASHSSAAGVLRD